MYKVQKLKNLRFNKKTNAKNAVSMMTYKKGKYTREQISRLAQKLSDDLKKEGFKGEVNVVLPYPDKYKAGRFTDVGEPVDLFSYQVYEPEGEEENVDLDPEYYDHFLMFINKHGKNNGKTDNNYNDCFYNCLKELIPENELKKVFQTPASLKEYLQLKRDDGISTDDIPKIEEKLKDYKINVFGEYTYSSTKEAKYDIFLELKDEHYSIDRKNMWQMHSTFTEEKYPLIYYFINKETVRIFDGKKMYKITKEKFMEKKNDYRYPYLFIKKDNELSLQDSYAQFITEADLLKELTKGKINMYKTNSYRLTAMQLFHDLTPNIQPEDIKPDEAEWIERTTRGPMAWAKKYKGKCYKYDIVSYYPNIMKNQKFSVPIKRGKFIKLTKEQFDKLTFYQFGIYRCIIKNADYRYIKTDNDNYHTHIDLTLAKKMNYEIELIEDEQPNFLHWDANSRVNGNKIFDNFINYLFPLKQQGHEVAKKLINVLWGGLCQKNKIRLIHNEKQITTIRKDQTMTEITPILNKENEFDVIVRDNETYCTNFARLAPFLLATGRKMIVNVMAPNMKNIVRVHTDGFISTKKLEFSSNKSNKGSGSIDYVKFGKDIGNIKYEGYNDNINIHHVNKIDGLHEFHFE